MAGNALVEVLEVSVERAPGEGALAGGGIDVPEPGARRPTFDLEIRGWAIDRRSPAVAVEVVHDDIAVGAAPIEIARPKLAARHPATAAGDRIGFRVQLGLLRVPTEFDLAVRAVTEDGERATIARLRGRRAEIRTGFEPRFQPLMLTTLGRTGSMMLMQMLEAHPEILVYRPFRYEQRVASYWLEVLIALSEPASYFRQIAPAGSLDDRRWWLGEDGVTPSGLRDEQLQHWLGAGAVRELAEVSQVRVERLYEQLAGRLDDAAAPRFFAEKYALELSHLVRELYPGAREVFLVRDFRDMVSSIIAFNEKRGAAGFGRGAVASDLEYVRSLGAWAARLEQAHARRSDAAIVVRYEDLVLDPGPALRALLEHVGVESSEPIVGRMVDALAGELAELAEHRTAADPRASIGRWQRDLGDELLGACDEAFGPALEAFGYER